MTETRDRGYGRTDAKAANGEGTSGEGRPPRGGLPAVWTVESTVGGGRRSGQPVGSRVSPRTALMPANPFEPQWARAVLPALAARARAGEDPAVLREELFAKLWPWAAARADHLAARAPAKTDSDAIKSELLLAVWQTMGRIDWERAEALPCLLKQRLAGAQIDALRASGGLSRRLRTARRTLATAQARIEQAEGRSLSEAEVAQLAGRLWPKARAGWVEAMLTDGAAPAALAPGAIGPDPEEHVLRMESRAAVQRWLSDDLPPDLRADLLRWFHRPRRPAGLPSRLSVQLAPYLDRLERAAGGA